MEALCKLSFFDVFIPTDVFKLGFCCNVSFAESHSTQGLNCKIIQIPTLGTQVRLVRSFVTANNFLQKNQGFNVFCAFFLEPRQNLKFSGEFTVTNPYEPHTNLAWDTVTQDLTNVTPEASVSHFLV